MSDAGKAREIGNCYARQYRHNYGGNDFVFSNEECEQSALEMAEWKDQQFKEYLKKKKDNYMRHREMWQQDTFEWGCYDSQIDTIDEIINELFGE